MTHLTLGEGPPLDFPELLTTRLFVQGSSGSGKTNLIRVLLEAAPSGVQQLIIDPDGDFRYLGALLGHSVIDAATYADRLPELADQVRRTRISALLDLASLLDPAEQVAAVGAFLSAFFAVDATAWHPCLVVLDEVHLFAGVDSAGDKPTRARAAGAVANLMCRGRKRGLCGVLASQRVAKVNKSAVGDVLNFLVGRTFLDIDVARAAKLVGLPRAEAGRLSLLGRGEFVARGPAFGLTPTTLKVRAAPTHTLADPTHPLGALVVPDVAPARPALAPTPRRLPEPLPALLAALRAAPAWPGYVALAKTTPGVINAVHAKGLCDALVGAGYLALTEGAHGRTFALPRG